MKKFVFLIFSLLITFSLYGCANTSHNQITNVKETISKVQTVVSQVTVLPSNSLLIDELMSENEVITTSGENAIDYDNINTTNSTIIAKYVAKLYSLTNIAQKTINLNQNTEYLISSVNSKTNSLKDICDCLVKKNSNITKSNSSALYDLCESILTNVNRLNISKDDVRNETSQIVALKKNYTSNVEKLSGKYSKLVNSLETRNNYLNNICYGLDKIYDIVIEICYPNASQEKTQKTWSNTDTYTNSNTKANRQANKQYEYNNENNQYSYGYGGTNPFYGYGMFGGYCGMRGMMGRYPFSPYTNYNPYIPNIDTFGTYKNIDTYKPKEKPTQENEEEKQEKPYYPYGTYDKNEFNNYSKGQKSLQKERTQKIHIRKVEDKPKIERLKKA